MSKTTAIIATLILLLVAQNSWMWLGRLGRRRSARRRSRRAVRGEAEAKSMVERHGYKIVEEQAERTWTIHVDGEPLQINLRADLVLTRDGRRFVADVKTGKGAPRISTASTRRQLIEYAFAYPVDGVLLVDMENRTLHSVDFGPVKHVVRRPIGQLIAAFLIGAASALATLAW